MTLDPRLNAYRADLADARLEGKVAAGRYVDGVQRQVIEPVANVHAEPRNDAQCISQALMGERVMVFDEHEGWAWGQLADDGYVGYLPAAALSAELVEPTHRVSVLSSYLYTAPAIKTQPVIAVYLNSKLKVTGFEGDFARLADGRFAWASHLRPIAEVAADPAGIAEQFHYVPYLWGGKTKAGVDCSGLIQTSYGAAGLDCPRDSDMMQQTIGKPLLINDLSGLQRGDLVFWQGHMGMMLDAERLIHANGYHMATVIEPLCDAVERIGAMFGPVTGFRRP